jgi:hypothetical protein
MVLCAAKSTPGPQWQRWFDFAAFQGDAAGIMYKFYGTAFGSKYTGSNAKPD